MNLITGLLLVALSVSTSPHQTRSTDVDSNPERARIAAAIERGDLEPVRTYVDSGGDVNDAWRDVPAQIVRSLVLRSIWYGQEDIFNLLLERGADLSSVRGHFTVAIHSGRVGIVRTLLAKGVKPDNEQDVVYAALQEKNLPIIDLLFTSGLSKPFQPADLPVYFLTNEITRLLVPKYVSVNATTALGNEPCDFERLSRTLRRDQDGCEWGHGPLWLHFVVTGNAEMVSYLLEQGADRNARGEAPTNRGTRTFTAMDIARARNDKRMMQLLGR